MVESSDTFEHEWVCRWSHADPAGIAYFPRLVIACHQASDAFMESIGWPLWENPSEHGLSLPVVETGYSFEHPVRPGDRIKIAVGAELGTTSLRLEQNARNEAGTTVFTGFEQHVCMDLQTNESTPIPDGLRGALQTPDEGS